MKKILSWIFILLLVLSPFSSGLYANPAANPDAKAPDKPYEQVIHQNGPWFSGPFYYEGVHSLSSYYNGPYEIDYSTVSATMPADILEKQALGKFTTKKAFDLAHFSAEYLFPTNELTRGATMYTGYPESIQAYLENAQTGAVVGPIILKPFGGFDSKKFDEGTLEQIILEYKNDPSDERVLLKKGTYYVYLTEIDHLIINPSTGYGGAWLVTGRLTGAMDKYYEELEEYEASQIMVSVESPALIPGINENLKEVYTSEASMDYAKGWEANPGMSEPIGLTFESVTRIDEIILNTSREPLTTGLASGIGGTNQAADFVIRDAMGEVVYVSTATQEVISGGAGSLAVSMPNAVLAAGNYTLEYARPQAVLTTPQGKPDIYIATSPAVEPQMGVTGTYKVNVDSYKTSTLMGPVNDTTSSFSLTNHEFAVIDQGDKLQITTKYENLPYAIMANVTERTANKVVASLTFNADFMKTPMKSKISSVDEITFTKTGNGVTITAAGTANYERAATKEKGADYNTYRIAGKGFRVRIELPVYVTAALEKAGVSAGRIPGPDSPGELAIGLIFPSAIGLVGHLVKTAFEEAKAKRAAERGEDAEGGLVPNKNLSVGEKAMAEANNSLGKGLSTEEEKRAMKILAEAMGNTDEPDEGDQISIGDNEKPGGSDYIAPESKSDYSSGDYESGDYESDDFEAEDYEADDYESESSTTSDDDNNPDSEIEKPTATKPALEPEDPLQKEIDEWEENLKSSKETAEAGDPRSEQLHKEYQDYIDHLKAEKEARDNPFVEPFTMEVVVDHTGRKETIIYNEDEDTWTVESSGNEFKMGVYERDVLPEFQKTRDFLEEQRRKFAERDTAFDKYLAEEKKKAELKANLLNKLMKERDQSFGIAPPAPGVGDVTAKYKDLIDKLSSGEIDYEAAQEERKKAFKVLHGRKSGRTMSEEQKDFENDLYGSNMSIAANTFKNGVEDIIAGDTYGGMAGRVAIAIATGGASEWVLTPAEALLDMKRMYESGFADKARAFMKSKGYNVDNLSDEEIIFLTATGKVVLGEAIGEGAGHLAKGLGKAGKALVKAELGEQGAKEFFGWAGDQASKGMKKLVDVGNKPVTKALKEATEGAEKKVKDIADWATGKSTAKDAIPDPNLAKANSEYIKYKAEVKKTVQEVTDKLQSGKELSESELAKTLRDTGVPRDMKKLKPELQTKFQNELDSKIYKPTNEATVKELSQDPNLVPEIKGVPKDQYEIEVVQIRTPKDPNGGFTSPINADNDVYGRVKIFATDKQGNILIDSEGNKVVKEYIEVPAKKVQGIYQKNFAQKTGYAKPDPNDSKKLIFDVEKAAKDMPEGIKVVDPDTGKTSTVSWEDATDAQRIKAVSDKHNQEVTDVFNPQSSRDFSKFQNKDHVSNVEKILKGEPGANLSDAQQLAQMESNKINTFFNNGGVANDAEAFIQLSKMGNMADKLNNAYQKAGYDIKSLPYDMKQAIKVAGDDTLSPAARQKALKEFGFTDAKDLANKLSGQIESLKTAKKSSGGTSFSVTKTVVKQYVKSQTFKEGGQ